MINRLIIIIFALFVSALGTDAHCVAITRPNPDNPHAYLPLLHALFSDFHSKYHHYPKTWEDTEVNCGDDKTLPGCGTLVMRTRHRAMNPPRYDGRRSRVTYVIAYSGRTTYRIDARDGTGKILFYSDQKHPVMPELR